MATTNIAGTNANSSVQEIQIGAHVAPALTSQHVEEIRGECLQGRRLICGKIIKVLPDGLIVESGYTDLLRAPLTKSWLIPGTVLASRSPHLVEGKEPGCPAVGLVYLTNLPQRRPVKPHQYDYVIIQAYPAGQSTYGSIGNIKRTVRRFATTLPQAVQIRLQGEENQNKVPAATK